VLTITTKKQNKPLCTRSPEVVGVIVVLLEVVVVLLEVVVVLLEVVIVLLEVIAVLLKVVVVLFNPSTQDGASVEDGALSESSRACGYSPERPVCGSSLAAMSPPALEAAAGAEMHLADSDTTTATAVETQTERSTNNLADCRGPTELRFALPGSNA